MCYRGVWQPSYLYDMNSHNWLDGFYIATGPPFRYIKCKMFYYKGDLILFVLEYNRRDKYVVDYLVAVLQSKKYYSSNYSYSHGIASWCGDMDFLSKILMNAEIITPDTQSTWQSNRNSPSAEINQFYWIVERSNSRSGSFQHISRS